MSEKQPPLAQEAFNTAVSFHEGAIRCRTDEVDPDTGCSVSVMAPAVVNAAFAAEMYMKALVTRRGELIEGHNLAWLFKNALNEVERETIAKHFSDRTRGAEYASMVTAIEALARVFVEWRYVYEAAERPVDVGSLMAFVGATYMAARELEPKWPVSEYLHERFTAGAGGMTVVYAAEGLTLEQALAKFGLKT